MIDKCLQLRILTVINSRKLRLFFFIFFFFLYFYFFSVFLYAKKNGLFTAQFARLYKNKLLEKIKLVKMCLFIVFNEYTNKS